MLSSSVLVPHGLSSNIYVREIGRAYQRLGAKVTYHPDNLAESNTVPDLLHLHWPEEHYRWEGIGSPEERAESFLKRLASFKSKGTQIVWTVHNITPHEFRANSLDSRVYQAVIELSDLLVHHCECSKLLLEQAYFVGPDKVQIVCPHGHFLAYPSGVTKAEARRKLGIAKDAFVYLQFGQIRAYKGISLMLRAFSRLRLRNKHLLIAGRYTAQKGGAKVIERIRVAFVKRFNARAHLFLTEVAHEDVQIYMSAADVLVLTHTSGLNSGVAVLGMSFGIPVIAPDMGCLGSVLGKVDNFLYQPDNLEQLVASMMYAESANLAEIGQRNRLAAQTWSWDEMIAAILRILKTAGTENMVGSQVKVQAGSVGPS